MARRVAPQDQIFSAPGLVCQIGADIRRKSGEGIRLGLGDQGFPNGGCSMFKSGLMARASALVVAALMSGATWAEGARSQYNLPKGVTEISHEVHHLHNAVLIVMCVIAVSMSAIVAGVPTMTPPRSVPAFSRGWLNARQNRWRTSAPG